MPENTEWESWYRDVMAKLAKRPELKIEPPEITYGYGAVKKDRWTEAFDMGRTPTQAVAEAVAEANTGRMF